MLTASTLVSVAVALAAGPLGYDALQAALGFWLYGTLASISTALR